MGKAGMERARGERADGRKPEKLSGPEKRNLSL